MLRNPHHIYGEGNIQVPLHLNFGKYILDGIWSYNDRVALINGHTHETLSYREIAKNAMRLAISLNRMGIKKGDVIGICSENRQEYLTTVIGIICTGAVVTVFNPVCTEGELKHVLEVSKPKMLFCSPLAHKSQVKLLQSFPYLKSIVLYGTERANNTFLYDDLIKPIIEDLSLEKFEVADVVGQVDTAFILYSSGTTGLQKGVMLTHLNVITSCQLPSGTNPALMSLFITPWYHVLGLIAMMRGLVLGSTAVYLAKFEADYYMRTIETYKIAQLTVAPPVLIACCKCETNYDVSSIKLIYSGAAPLRIDTLKAAKQRFPNLELLLQGYGMTEVTLAVTRDTYNKVTKAGSVGRVVPGSIVKVVDVETGKTLGPNQSGEICVKSVTIMKGYIGKENRDFFDEEGFFKTGDIGYYDDDKYFFIVDRLKELIKYKGYQITLLAHRGFVKGNYGELTSRRRPALKYQAKSFHNTFKHVLPTPDLELVKGGGMMVLDTLTCKDHHFNRVAPAELEAVLLQHPGIRDAGVVGIPHETAGEVPLAFVVLQSGFKLSEEDVKSFAAEKLSHYKHIRGGVRYLHEIPKNPSGKILRKRLREMMNTKSKL